MTWRIEVITPFVGDGTGGNANRPQMGDDYTFIRWTDITATPSAQLTPSPNMYVIKAEVTEAVLNSIESDGTYHVLSSEEIILDGWDQLSGMNLGGN